MKKEILFVSAINDGGISTYLSQMTMLASINRGSFLISLAAFKKPQNAPVPNFTAEFYLPNSKARGLFIIGRLVEEIFWLRKVVLELNPDIIISVDTHSNFIACFVKKMFFSKKKLIITNHNNVEEIVKEKLPFFMRSPIRVAGRLLFSEADRIVCISKGLSKSYKKYFRLNQQIVTIEYGIDLEKARRKGDESLDRKSKKYFSADKKTIVAVGRLVSQKDFATLIEAVKLVSRNIKNIQLIVIGEGEDRSLIESQIKRLGLESTVHLLGWKKNVYPYFRNADLSVLSSHYEGFGYVLLEAMSQGIPVVSTDSQFGPSEIINNREYGLLVKVKNTRQMASAIINICKNKSLRKNLSDGSKKRVRDYKEERMLSSYSKLINEILLDRKSNQWDNSNIDL